MNKNNYCVIMAGGIGSRFWPFSRQARPKQFLDILGIGKTLLRITYERLSPIIPDENFLVVTNEDYRDLVAEQLPELSADQILLEPHRRNTAPCIAYANFRILQKNPNANIVVAPSDHLILDVEGFLNVIKQGLEFVRTHDALLTIGITPSRPETGYGYIQKEVDSEINQALGNISPVKTFTEKPIFEIAKFFYESGEYYWNSGMFLWSLPSIMKAFNQFLPEVQSLFEAGTQVYGTSREADFIRETYSDCTSISIDNGVMEAADNVYVICADFGWTDLGTWGSLYENLPKNAQQNSVPNDNTFLYNTQKSIVKTQDNKITVIEGLNDMIVVDTPDVLLICSKQNEQQIKHYVAEIKNSFGDKYI